MKFICGINSGRSRQVLGGRPPNKYCEAIFDSFTELSKHVKECHKTKHRKTLSPPSTDAPRRISTLTSVRGLDRTKQ